MTELMKNILDEPQQLSNCLSYTLGPGRSALQNAAGIIKSARHVFITGIGSSANAAMGPLALFHRGGMPAYLLDASELLYTARIPLDSAVIILSRSGRSSEIVSLLREIKQRQAKIIAITNTPSSPLAQDSDETLNLEAAFDHVVSITMYSGLALVAGLLASEALGELDESLAGALLDSLLAAGHGLDCWRYSMEQSDWFSAEAIVYFLARRGSLGSCHEARLLWEEGAKLPASALGTGAFRHGSQETLREGSRLGLWLDRDVLRGEDIALASDIRKLGGKVFLIGQDVPVAAGDLVCPLPAAPGAWQFLIDIFPAQLAAEHMARIQGVDCDSFRICPYIIESEGGVLPESTLPSSPYAAAIK